MKYMFHFTRAPKSPNSMPYCLSNPQFEADSLVQARQIAKVSAPEETHMIEIENEGSGVSEFWVRDGSEGWVLKDA